MVDTVCELTLSIDEVLRIQKTRLKPNVLTGGEKRISIVTGSHGDELEGQYICYELIRRIKSDFTRLLGIVDVYPAINPIGMDSLQRELPISAVDMNRTFGSDYCVSAYGHLSKGVIDDIIGSDICVDIHSSDILTREVPHTRIHPSNRSELLPYATKMNTDFIWVSKTPAVSQGSLAYSLNGAGVPTLVVETGTGFRVDREDCNQIVDGLFALLYYAEVWNSEVGISRSEDGEWTEAEVWAEADRTVQADHSVTNPPICYDDDVSSLYAEKGGLFLPNVTDWDGVRKGDKLGDIVNPFTGALESEVVSRVSGKIFTLREYPIVAVGSLLARFCALY